MSVVIGKKYVIYSEILGLKYFIDATSWNIDILTYLADTPYKDRDHLPPFEDWTLVEEYDNKRRSGLLHELPLAIKETFEIDDMLHGGGGKKSTKCKIKKRKNKKRFTHCKRSCKVKSKSRRRRLWARLSGERGLY